MLKLRHSLIWGFQIMGLLFLYCHCGKAKYPEGLYAELITNKGTIVLQLDHEKTPMTVANFVGLAEGTIANQAYPEGLPYFDGSIFHRVVPGHVIQAGAPADEAVNSPGYTIPNEIHPDLSHGQAGILGMANGGPHTNGSQFYITLGDRSYLDGDYTVFGRVWEGMEVVKTITQDDIIQKILIVRVGKNARAFRPDNESFQTLVRKTQGIVEAEAEEKAQLEAAYIKTHWPEAITTESGWKQVIVQAGQGRQAAEGAVLHVFYTGHKINGDKFYSSAEAGKPQGSPPAQSFPYTLGESRVNPGIDQTLGEMKKGEKRILILPPENAYGTSGFYAKDIPGQKRFVISPNTTLIYEIELIEIE